MKWDALRDFSPFVKLKKREKHSRRRNTQKVISETIPTIIRIIYCLPENNLDTFNNLDCPIKLKNLVVYVENAVEVIKNGNLFINPL